MATRIMMKYYSPKEPNSTEYLENELAINKRKRAIVDDQLRLTSDRKSRKALLQIRQRLLSRIEEMEADLVKSKIE